MVEYTIWHSDANPKGKYMASLNCDTEHKRVRTADAPEMIADMYADYLHAFTLFKKDYPTISVASRKRDKASVLGKDGDDDLLESMLERAVYDRRKYTETFILLANGSDKKHITPASQKEWAAIGSEVANFLNSHIGQMRIAPSNDPGFYWLGHIAAEWKPEQYRGILTVTANVEPYKLEKYHSCEPWLWDDFSFIDGIIREYGDIPVPARAGGVDGKTTLYVPVRDMDMIPEFRVSGGTGWSYDSANTVTVALMDGETVQKSGNINYESFNAVDDTQEIRFAQHFSIPGYPIKYTSRKLVFTNTAASDITVAMKVRGGSL